jgi:hypothetical protein
MMAMLGVGMAGLGLMKSQTAVAKQKAQIQADASAQAQLASAMAHQSATASTNWATNQAMQASAYQRVVEQVVQSEVNKDYQTAFANFQSQERQRIQRIIDLVLQTTVTINLIPKTGLIQGFIRRSNLSLGTIANYNGQEVIVTHDHFDDNNRNGRASLTYIQANYSHIHLAGALGIVTLDTNDLGAIYNPVNGIMMLHLLNGNSFNVTPTVATIATNYFPDANENCYYSYVPGWNRDDAISSYNTTSNSIIDFVPYPALYVDIVRMTTMSSYHLSPTWGGEAGKGDSGTGLFNSNGELIGVFQTRDARNLTFGDRVGNIGYNLSEDKEASDPVFSNNNFNIIQ